MCRTIVDVSNPILRCLASVTGLVLASAALAGQPSQTTPQLAPAAKPKLWVLSCDPDAVQDVRSALDAADANLISHLGPYRWLIAGATDEVFDTPGVRRVVSHVRTIDDPERVKRLAARSG